MATSTARTGIIALLSAMSCGCQSLPDDHMLKRTLGSRLAKLGRHLEPTQYVDLGIRRLGKLPGQIVFAAERQPRLLATLWSNSTELAGSVVDRTLGLPGHVTSALEAGGTAALRRTSSLAGIATATALNPTFYASRISKAGRGVRSTVDELLFRPIMPEPSDPEFSTEVRPTRRQLSWFERVLKRIPF